jgi:coenzyme F420-reducing hydrogenase alpha subunit
MPSRGRPGHPFGIQFPLAGFDAHLIEEQVPRSTALHARLTDGGRYIVPLTSQNQAASEADLREFVQAHMDLDDAELTRRCGQAIRNYDPCVSCSAHFLDLIIMRAASSSSPLRRAS